MGNYTINFAEETMDVLKHNCYNENDVDCVTNKYTDTKYEFLDFINVAKTIDYNPGYGIEEIDTGLIILMKNGCWFERKEYDGSEWWSYICPPNAYGKIKIMPTCDDLLSWAHYSDEEDEEEEDELDKYADYEE